jgi:hypothetical protein
MTRKGLSIEPIGISAAPTCGGEVKADSGLCAWGRLKVAKALREVNGTNQSLCSYALDSHTQRARNQDYCLTNGLFASMHPFEIK